MADEELGAGAGVAYVFERDAGGAWLQAAKLLASDGAAGDAFGSAVAVAAQVVVAGAPAHDQAGIGDAGAAYVFEQDAGGPGAWGETAKLADTVPFAGDLFGGSVATNGDNVVVGIPSDDDAFFHNSGAISIFSQTPWPEGQVCLAFQGFCDGLEIRVIGDLMIGLWSNVDCVGKTRPLVGMIGVGLPQCPDPANPTLAALVCLPDLGCTPSGIERWHFLFDGLDGSMDIGLASSTPRRATTSTSAYFSPKVGEKAALRAISGLSRSTYRARKGAALDDRL